MLTSPRDPDGSSFLFLHVKRKRTLTKYSSTWRWIQNAAVLQHTLNEPCVICETSFSWWEICATWTTKQQASYVQMFKWEMLNLQTLLANIQYNQSKYRRLQQERGSLQRSPWPASNLSCQAATEMRRSLTVKNKLINAISRAPRNGVHGN